MCLWLVKCINNYFTIVNTINNLRFITIGAPYFNNSNGIYFIRLYIIKITNKY